MSNYIAVDTSSRYLTVAALKDGKSVVRYLPDCAMRHSVILMDEIECALSEVGLSPFECDFFAVVTGPGSFTGIRIGISAIKGFALAADKPIKAVTAFDLLSYNINSEKYSVIIDAAHDHYYVCGYENGRIVLPPCYMSVEEVVKLNCALYGFEDLRFENYNKLDVKNLLPIAAEKAEVSKEVHALYVRKSQAEENLNANKKVEL